jgi:mannosyl-oligosaccharide alpha-1,2-mannosidase
LAVFDYLRNYKLAIPGLYPTYMNTRTGKFSEPFRYSIANDADSFYEYILKIWISTGHERFRIMFEEAADAVIEKLLVTSPLGTHTILSDGVGDSNKNFHHLSCFAGGMFTLGGATRRTKKWTLYLDVGRRVTDTCYAMYQVTPHGLGAEVGSLSDEGINIVQKTVSLRPETIESIFYQYRVTKDPKYREWGANIISSLNKYAKTEAGFHGLEGDKPMDSMESFFIAETLKYLYLLFSDHSVISLKEYVFNTEAHPFSIRGHGMRKDPKKWVGI